MTKEDFITELSQRMQVSFVDAGKALHHFVGALQSVLMKGEELTLPGFGKFTVRKKSAREMRHPQTGGKLKVDAKSVPVFKAGDALKMQVNNALRKE